jgi:hypothetical protein
MLGTAAMFNLLGTLVLSDFQELGGIPFSYSVKSRMGLEPVVQKPTSSDHLSYSSHCCIHFVPTLENFRGWGSGYGAWTLSRMACSVGFFGWCHYRLTLDPEVHFQGALPWF